MYMASVWTDRVDLWFLQCQAVALPHVRVALQHKHGDHSLSCHDDHVWICHRAVHYGSAQVHRDKVELCHWEQEEKRPGETPDPSIIRSQLHAHWCGSSPPSSSLMPIGDTWMMYLLSPMLPAYTVGPCVAKPLVSSSIISWPVCRI